MRTFNPLKCIHIICLFLAVLFLFSVVSAPVTALAANQEIKLNVKSKTIVKDKTYALKVYNLSEDQTVTFQSSDPTIASVDEAGLITANALGETIINVIVKDIDAKVVVTLQCSITVGPPALSVKLTKSQSHIYLMLGKKAILKTILQPTNTAEEIKFSSSDILVATISPSGRVTAKDVGVTYIFAALDNGKFDFCTIEVLDEETYYEMFGETEEDFVDDAEAVITTQPAEPTAGASEAEPVVDNAVTPSPEPSVIPVISTTPNELVLLQ